MHNANRAGQRGSILIESILSVVIVAGILASLNYAYRTAEHYASVWGTVAGFSRMYEAERSYRRAGHTGPIDYTQMQVLMPGVKVHSATSAHRNGVGRPYELQTVGGVQKLTTVVDNEAQAQQVVRKLPNGKATYAADSDGFRVTLHQVYVDPLERLIQRHSMHVSGPHGTHLKDRLNFGPGAVVTVGSRCLPPDGIWSGGIAIDAAGRPVVCVRIAPGTSTPDRVWELVPSRASENAVVEQLQESCRDGTPVEDRIDDCKDCPDGSNIPNDATCPSNVIPRCGDGTAVANVDTECKDCPDGTNIHVADLCPAIPPEQCGDGIRVHDRKVECQNCWDGTNIHVGDRCPPRVQLYCGDGSPVVNQATECKDCWDDTNIYHTLTCPKQPTVEYCGDGTVVGDRASECQDCWDGTNIYHALTCPKQPIVDRCGDGTVVGDRLTDCKNCGDGSNIPLADTCPVGASCWDGSTVYPPAVCPTQPACGDGTKVTDRATDCKDCTDGTNIHASKNCPTGAKCWNGSIVFPPTTCPPQPECGDGTKVIDPTKDCKNCSDGSNIPVGNACPVECPCGGFAASLAACPPVTMKSCPNGCSSVCPQDACATPTHSGPTSCTPGFSLVETTGACAITSECVADACPCGAIRQSDGACPVVDKTEMGATSCPSGYSKVKVSETACSITHECQKTCPCGGGTVTHPANCPAIVKDELGPTSCVSGYRRVKTAESQCSITYACQQDCPCDGGAVTYPDLCPRIVKDQLGPSSCPTGYDRLADSTSECSITFACKRDCPCDGGAVTHPATCPAVVKDETGPTRCPSGYSRTLFSETTCTKAYVCEKTCPCTGSTVRHPNDCPPVVKKQLGERSCPSGCNLATVAQDECTITGACHVSCWDKSVNPCAEGCPDKPVRCANGNDYPNCCCPTMTPIITEYVDEIVWSCPAKPVTGVPLDIDPGPHWTVVITETECSIHRDLVCTGSLGACFGPGNYCQNPVQVWWGSDGRVCDNPSCGGNTGFLCTSDGIVGPGP